MGRIGLLLIAVLLATTCVDCGRSDSRSGQSTAEPALPDSAPAVAAAPADTQAQAQGLSLNLKRKLTEEEYQSIVIDTAPQFSLPDLNHIKVSLSDYKGYVVLVNFWSTQFDACRALYPTLANLYGRYRDSGLVVLGICMDQMPYDKMQRYVDWNRIPYPVLRGTRTEIRAFKIVTPPPVSFIIDRRGNIVTRFFGNPGEAEIENSLKLFL